MGKTGVKLPAKETIDPIRTSDLLDMMQYLQNEHNLTTQVVLRLSATTGGAYFSASFEARKPAIGEAGELMECVIGRWPCSSHKHLLGLLLWLGNQLDDRLNASDVLGALSPA